MTSYGYDGDRQLSSITPATGNSLAARSYTYDGFGRMATATNGRGITETYDYDDQDRVVEIDYSDGTPSVSYTYDAAGQVQARTDGSGVTTYTYDPLGRLASRTHTAGGGVLTYRYDRGGNLVEETGASGTTTHSYDVRNLPTRTVTPDGQQIGFGHDPDGQRVDTWFGTNEANTAWSAHTRKEFDSSNRLIRVWTARASNDADRVSDLSYGYASPGTDACATAPAAGQDTSLRWTQTDHVAGRTTTYCYDQASRLTSASTPGGDSWAYTYDGNGNRTQTTKNGSVVQTLTVNNADQVTTNNYGYDGSGNLTSAPGGTQLTYNGSQQMTNRSSSGGYDGLHSSYTYAGSDQRELISQVLPNGSTHAYAYGRTDQQGLPLLASISNPNGQSYLVHDDGGTPLALKAHTGNYVYYVLDGLGSPVGLINTRGVLVSTYSYDPYGQVTEANLTGNAVTALNPYRFAGGMYDRAAPTYVKFGMRWYDAGTGRFTQQDSIETLADPSRANRYEYAASNPTNYVDPTGQDFLDVVNEVVDAAVYIAGQATGAGLLAGGGAAVAGCVTGAVLGPVGCAYGATTGFVSGFITGTIAGGIAATYDYFN